MPPRFAYWTIILEGKPTAFRAQQREELIPTFKQLHAKHPDAVMKWFSRGRLWESPEEAQAAVRGGGPTERRKPDWRPGGEHRDPRARFDIPRDEKRRRFAERLRRETRERPTSPPEEQRDRATRRDEGQFSRPEWKPRPPGGGSRGTPTGPRPSRPRGGESRPKWKPTGASRPPRQPTGEGRPPWKPSGEPRPPRQPTGEARPPWKPNRESRPPRQPAGEGRPQWKNKDDRRPPKPDWKPGDRDSRKPTGSRPPRDREPQRREWKPGGNAPKPPWNRGKPRPAPNRGRGPKPGGGNRGGGGQGR
jgi:hypothetical protein